MHLKFLCLFCAAYSMLLGEQWKTIYLASFPRSGNHWVRFLVEEATHIATSSVYRDRDFPHLQSMFPWGAYSTDHGYEGQCRFPTQDDPVLIKTHYPFLPRKIEPEPHHAICLIRHPVDSFWSFYIYKGGKEEFIDKTLLAEFVQRWRQFYEFWEQQEVLFIRYEDLQEDTHFHLASILQAAGYTFNQADIDRAISKYSSKGELLKHIAHYDTQDIELIRSELADILTKFGYAL